MCTGHMLLGDKIDYMYNYFQLKAEGWGAVYHRILFKMPTMGVIFFW